MSNTISPNMGLVIPGVGTELGPTWATDLNASLSIIDQHNHSGGQGVQINPSGLNINSDLSFQNNNAIGLRSSRYQSQSAALALTSDLGIISNINGNLYWNNNSGTPVQITSGSSIVGTAGSISGLPSGTASASYAAGTFVWQSATNTSAVMDAGSVVLRNNTAGSKGLTLAPPNAMAADYGLFLPSVPASTSFMTLDTSGNMAASIPTANGITRSNQAAVGQQIGSSTSTSYNNTTTTYLVGPGGSPVSITTTGRPVFLCLQPAGSGQQALVLASPNASASGFGALIAIGRDGVTSPMLAEWQLTFSYPTASAFYLASSVGSFCYLDTPSAGTHIYRIYIAVTNTPGEIQLENYRLVAYEL